MEILKKQVAENKLMHRNDVYLLIKSNVTPSRKELIEEIKKIFGVEERRIDLNRIETKFGSHEVVVYASIYDSEEWLKRFKRGKKKEKGEESKGGKEGEAKSGEGGEGKEGERQEKK
ncbi:MAG: hypothetical protein QXS07_01250 [Candidatus Pacearchaeota archaeon]